MNLPWKFYGYTVRLVRACGSKLHHVPNGSNGGSGQARKSLWIETEELEAARADKQGQARKSLWIETPVNGDIHANLSGQARKSLWIETET